MQRLTTCARCDRTYHSDQTCPWCGARNEDRVVIVGEGDTFPTTAPPEVDPRDTTTTTPDDDTDRDEI